MEKSKNLPSIETIIAPFIECFMKKAQHLGCGLSSWPSNEYTELWVITVKALNSGKFGCQQIVHY